MSTRDILQNGIHLGEIETDDATGEATIKIIAGIGHTGYHPLYKLNNSRHVDFTAANQAILDYQKHLREIMPDVVSAGLKGHSGEC